MPIHAAISSKYKGKVREVVVWSNKPRDILGERFRELREAIAAWSKETVTLAHPFVSRNAFDSAELNLRIVRTIFSKCSIEILTVLYSPKSIGFEELRKTLKG